MKTGAVLSLLLCLAAVTQGLEVLVNPDINGCEITDGGPVTSWTGAGPSYRHTTYAFLFTSIPPVDVCFGSLYSNPPTPLDRLTQNINVATSGTYDFSAMVACYSTGPGNSCNYFLTIDGVNFPLTGAATFANNPATYILVTASNIPILAGTRALSFRLTTPVPNSVQAYVTKMSLLFVAAGSGDPHMVGFQGQRFDYIGEPDQVVNLVTDPELQVNTLLGLMKAGDFTFIDGPVMMQMAFMTRGHTVIVNAGGHQKDQIGFVSVDGVLLPLGQSFLDGILSVTFTALNTNSKDLGLTGDDHVVGQVDVKLEGMYEFRVFMIENGRDPENPENWLVKYPRRFLDFNASLLDLDRRPHGVLGQTAAPLGKERSVGEWTIEGKDEDYVVKDGLTGTQFSFNLFL